MSASPQKSDATAIDVESDPAQNPYTPEDVLRIASLIADRSDIESVILLSSSTRRVGTIDPSPDTSVMNAEITNVAFSQDLFADKIYVMPSFRFTIRLKEESGGSEQVSIDATFAVGYVVPGLGEATDDQKQAFAVSTGLFNCWPYWREFLQSTTVRMGIPAVVLPPFRI